MSSKNSEKFTSSFPILLSFIYFNCLYFMAKTANTMLTTSGENGHPCLIPNLQFSSVQS